MELKPYLTIEQYISNFPHSTQEKLNELRKLLNSIAPNAKEKISYGMPAFTLNGMFLYFAGYSKHIGFYPGVNTIEAFKSELTKYKTSKATVQFPLNQALPIALIKRMIEFRMAEIQKKADKKNTI